jgi:hypothetical protein
MKRALKEVVKDIDEVRIKLNELLDELKQDHQNPLYYSRVIDESKLSGDIEVDINDH